MPGYGWIFPVGNGTINVGIGLLSTFRDYREVNTTHLFEEFTRTLPTYWQIDPEHPIAPPIGGRLPMAGSVGPKAGGNWLVVGDAAGSINGNPTLINELTRVGMRSRPLMEWALRIMANLMRDEERGAAETAYRAIASAVELVPDRLINA